MQGENTNSSKLQLETLDNREVLSAVGGVESTLLATLPGGTGGDVIVFGGTTPEPEGEIKMPDYGIPPEYQLARFGSDGLTILPPGVSDDDSIQGGGRNDTIDGGSGNDIV